MSIQPVNYCTYGTGHTQQNVNRTVPMRAKATNNVQVTESNAKSKKKKWLIAIGTTITLIGLYALGKKGRLGDGIKNFLNGTKKAAGEVAENAEKQAANSLKNNVKETEVIVEDIVDEIPKSKNALVFGETVKESPKGKDIHEAINEATAGNKTKTPLEEVYNKGKTQKPAEVPPTVTAESKVEVNPKATETPKTQNKTDAPTVEESKTPKYTTEQNNIGLENTEIYSIQDDISSNVTERFNVKSEPGIDIMNKGSFGQDIHDPFDPLNEIDIMSPYYKNPYTDISDPLNPMNQSCIWDNNLLGNNDLFGSLF